MTNKQRDVLNYIKRYWKDNGFAPSYDNIADDLELGSKSNAYRYVHNLIDRGFITALPGQSRSVTPTNLLAEELPDPEGLEA